MSTGVAAGHDRRVDTRGGRRALLIGVRHFEPAELAGEPSLQDPGWQELELAHDRVKTLERVLRDYPAGDFQVERIEDPDRDALVDAVRRCLSNDSARCRIVHVVSHGRTSLTQPDRLDMVPARGKPGAGTNVTGWVSDAQELDRPTLFLVDLCFAGKIAQPVWLAQLRDEHVKAWVIAASWRDERAYDCRFSAVVADVLARCAEDGLNTDASVEHVTFTALVRAIGDEMARRYGSAQTISWTKAQDAKRLDLPFLPNPHWRDDPVLRSTAVLDSPLRTFLEDEVADPDHFRLRAGHHFTGRRAELAQLAPWLDGTREAHVGLRVVTGSPGVGKSALIGALVCAAHPELAGIVPHLMDRLAPASRPRINHTLAAVHARHRRLDELVASIGRQLRLAEPADGWTAATLVDAVAALPHPPVIVLDALDECPEAGAVQALLLLPLAMARRSDVDGRGSDSDPVCRLLVGVRPWDEFWTLLDAAGQHGGLLDLDHVDPQTLTADLMDYVHGLLGGIPGYADADRAWARARVARGIATRLAAAAAQWGAFLVAGMYANYLGRIAPPTTLREADEVAAAVPVDLPSVLELELTTHDRAGRLRAVLSALAFAKGDGMPADLVAAVAARMGTGPSQQETMALLREPARFYLRTVPDRDATTLYRLFHQGLADYLRRHPDAAPTDRSSTEGAVIAPDAGRAGDEHAGRVLGALLATRQDTGEPTGETLMGWEHAPPYLLRHAIQHAADAGRVDELLTDPELLVHAEPATLVPELRGASSSRARMLAAVYRQSLGRHIGADPAIRRELLVLDALRFGDPVLARQIEREAAGPWRPRWATGGQVSPAALATLIGHTGEITAVTCTVLDGRPVAITGSGDNTVRIWDLTTGQPHGQPLTGHTDEVAAVACTMLDGRPVAITSSGDGTVRIWDLTTGQPRGRPLTVSTIGVACTVLNGRPVAVTSSDDGTLWIWDLTTRRPRGRPLTGHTDEAAAVACTVLDGRPVAVVGSVDHTVRIWDLTTGQPRGQPLTGHTDVVWGVACTVLDGRPVAVTNSGDGTVRIWDLTSGRGCGRPLTGITGGVVGVACMVLDGQPIAVTGGGDGTVRTWDLTTRRPRGRPLTGHTDEITAVACTVLDAQPVAVTGSRDGTVRIWDLTTGRPRGRPLTGHTLSVDAVACTVLNGRPVAVSGGYNDPMRIWDLTTSRPHGRPLIGRADIIWAVAGTVLAGRPVAVTGSGDGAVRIWDLTTGQPHRRPLTGHTGGVGAVACTVLNGRPVAVTGSDDGTVRIWNLAAGRSRKPLTGHTGGVYAVACTVLNGRPVAVTGGHDGTVRVWDLTTGRPHGQPLTGHTGGVGAVACTMLDGRPVAVTSGHDGTVRIWDLTTGAGVCVLSMPGPVQELAVGEGGELVVGIGWEVVVLEPVSRLADNGGRT